MNQRKYIGKVYLVGAGSGDPGLLTVKGKTLLEHADVVIYDALVSPEIIAIINPQAQKINAGKRQGSTLFTSNRKRRIYCELKQKTMRL